jgi:hypothetical protein
MSLTCSVFAVPFDNKAWIEKNLPGTWEKEIAKWVLTDEMLDVVPPSLIGRNYIFVDKACERSILGFLVKDVKVGVKVCQRLKDEKGKGLLELEDTAKSTPKAQLADSSIQIKSDLDGKDLGAPQRGAEPSGQGEPLPSAKAEVGLGETSRKLKVQMSEVSDAADDEEGEKVENVDNYEKNRTNGSKAFEYKIFYSSDPTNSKTAEFWFRAYVRRVLNNFEAFKLSPWLATASEDERVCTIFRTRPGECAHRRHQAGMYVPTRRYSRLRVDALAKLESLSLVCSTTSAPCRSRLLLSHGR